MLDPWYHECLRTAAGNRELVANFDRLTGYNLSLRGSPLDLAIDRATGREDAAAEAFCAFVYDTVYLRVPRPEPRP